MHHTFTQDVQPTSVPSFPQHGSGDHASQGHVQLLPQCGPGKYVSAAEFVGWSLFEKLRGTSDIKQWAEKMSTQSSSTARSAAAPRESHISLGGSGSYHSSRTNAFLLLQPCPRERATVPCNSGLHLEKHPWHRGCHRIWRANVLALKRQILEQEFTEQSASDWTRSAEWQRCGGNVRYVETGECQLPEGKGKGPAAKETLTPNADHSHGGDQHRRTHQRHAALQGGTEG